VIVAIVNMYAGSSMLGILVDGILHLAEEIVNMDKILMGAGARHRQVVLLSQRVVSNGRNTGTHAARDVRRLGHVMIGSSHGTLGDGQGAVERKKRATYVGVGRGINVAALGAAKEVVNHVVGTLAVITASGGSVVANVLRAGGVQRRLVKVHAIACRLLGSIVAARVTRLGVAGVTRTHLTIMVVVARGLGLSSVVEAAVLAGEDRIIGMCLDVLLQVLGAFEGLATELTLVRLERDVDSDM
jgi:hypothetical protein